jgi:hypothetical protein
MSIIDYRNTVVLPTSHPGAWYSIKFIVCENNCMKMTVFMYLRLASSFQHWMSENPTITWATDFVQDSMVIFLWKTNGPLMEHDVMDVITTWVTKHNLTVTLQQKHIDTILFRPEQQWQGTLLFQK